MRKFFALAAVALLLATRTVIAANPPEMMKGLWPIHSQSVDNPSNKKTELTSTLCRSHAYGEHVLELAKTTNHCTVTENVEASRYSVTTHCVVAETVVDSTSAAIYTDNTAARSEIHVTYKPALGGISEVTMVQDEKYVGKLPGRFAAGRFDARGREPRPSGGAIEPAARALLCRLAAKRAPCGLACQSFATRAVSWSAH